MSINGGCERVPLVCRGVTVDCGNTVVVAEPEEVMLLFPVVEVKTDAAATVAVAKIKFRTHSLFFNLSFNKVTIFVSL